MNKAADNYTGGNYDEFIALSKVQKTLRNELKSTPFTAEHIKQRGIISEDEYRAQQSLELKKIADEYYRNYITHKLNDINNLDFYNLLIVSFPLKFLSHFFLQNLFHMIIYNFYFLYKILYYFLFHFYLMKKLFLLAF